MARYSLHYYEALFPTKGRGFEELVEALAQELEDYAQEVSEGTKAGWGPEGWSRSRHSHRPLVINLGLHALEDLEAQLAKDPGAEGLVTSFVDEARAVARELRSEFPGR